MQALVKNSKNKIEPIDFEKKLNKFGNALIAFDENDEFDNTIFTLFDTLAVATAQAKKIVKNSSLTVESSLDGKEENKLTKMLFA